jgi:son of sevenless-like protein
MLVSRVLCLILRTQAWSKHDGIKAPNVMKLINGFNQTTYWVATEICSVAKLEQRVAMIVKMIEIAERCEQLHNFQTLMEILVGLSMGMVSRLTQSWDAVPKEKMSMFQKLQSLIDNRKNYANYRLVYRDAALPCFPYLGLQLKVFSWF